VRAAAVVENITSPRLGKHISERLQELGEQLAAGKRGLKTSRLQKAKRVVKRALRKTA
jgi:hypothetical protein